MSQEDRPLSSAFLSYMENFKLSINDSVRSEVTAAVAPFREKQEEIIEDLANTKNRVSEIEDDNVNTKTKVEELQKQMVTIQQKLICTASLSQNNSIPSNSSVPHNSPHPNQLPRPSPNNPSPDVLKVLQDAKRVLGFSPITIEDIEYLKEQYSISDDFQAMVTSIQEFLHFEMKIPTSITDKLVFNRIFPPAKQPTGWSTLYAEFQDTSYTELIQQYVRHLLPGKQVSMYVPHCLQPRFTAVGNIAHSYRNGDIKYKTKIKYGTSDFVLMVKPRFQNVPWTYISLANLPPLQLSSFDGNPSSSPPPGRSRITSKRVRADSDEEVGPPSSKTRNEDPKSDTLDVNDEDSKNDNEKVIDESMEGKATTNADHTSPTTLTPAPTTPSKQVVTAAGKAADIGSFLPSACVSPSAALNRNFTFGSQKSSIPKMMNPLNWFVLT